MEATTRVRTRRVHYISGFDPRGARYYHRLYREEAAKQAAHNTGRFVVGNRQTSDGRSSHWQIDAEWNGQTVSTDYRFMIWDDLVRKYWGGGLFSLLLAGFACYARYG